MTLPPVLLCIDAGNTLVKWCVLDAAHPDFSGDIQLHSHPTAELGSFDQICTGLGARLAPLLTGRQTPVVAVLLCNVLGPEFERAMGSLCDRHHLALHVLAVNASVPMVSQYENPCRLGKDRWAACLAVSQTSHSPVNLLVSFGTATTVDAVVNQSGWKHLGGFIVPGLRTMLDSLHFNTAELPQVELGVPAPTSGSCFWPLNTRQAIGEGVGRMQGAWISSLVNQLEQQHGQTPVVWFSGGFAQQMMSYFPQALLLEHAVFKGLVFDYHCAGQVGS